MPRIIISFNTTHAAIKSERVCMREKVPCTMIALPRQIASDCGVAMEIQPNDEGVVGTVLTSENIVFRINKI